MQGWGRGGRRKKTKSAKEMNQLLQGRLPELSPVLLFPRRKAVAGKRGRKDFLVLHSGAISWIHPCFQADDVDPAST